MTELPYYPDVKGAPQNSIIGGASLWVMGGKKPEEYKGIAKFFTYLSGTTVQEAWHEATGYLPITKAAYEATKASGFYDKNPGTEVAIMQMTGKPPTENSRGLRFGNLVQIRDVIAEDLEGAFAGKTDRQGRARRRRQPRQRAAAPVPEEHAVARVRAAPITRLAAPGTLSRKREREWTAPRSRRGG